jgi:citryl-CoA synthetase large subunit
MQLKEHEGKAIFRKHGIPVPQGVVAKDAAGAASALAGAQPPLVVKAQVLAGKRGKAGGIIRCQTAADVSAAAARLLGAPLLGETVQEILIEECLDIAEEHYLAIMLDTAARMPRAVLCRKGGMDIEEHQKANPAEVVSVLIDPLDGLHAWQARELALAAGFSEKAIAEIAGVLVKLYGAFVAEDCKLLEINPLIRTKPAALEAGRLVAGDAKAILDDDAEFRRELKFPARVGSRPPTEREIAARKVNDEDHRGVAGKTYLDLDGDIGVLASGGGASVTAMDALISYGGRPANYTEYSGNPPAEKVRKLADIVLSKPGLNGCWIVGGTANFTRIDITIQGIIEALAKARPGYPIVVRRAGPGDKEAFAMLRAAAEEHGLDIHIYDESTPITVSAKRMVELSEAYRRRRA